MYLEGMEEASIFVHVAVNDITGKVGAPDEALHVLYKDGFIPFLK